MQRVVISGTGLYTPSEAINNDELVVAFNGYVQSFNQRHAAEIADGTIAALAESSAEFLTKLTTCCDPLRTARSRTPSPPHR